MENQRPDVKWTIRYTLLNATYFVAFCTIHACAAVYLLANGFSNTEVGILLVVANILSAVLQPFVAGIIDKPGPLTNRRFILFSVLVILLGSAVLLLVPGNKWVIFPVFALIYMIQFVYQPVMTALCFEYQKAGCRIFYGLARGLGSASFAVTAAVIGGLVERSGVTLLLFVNIASMLLSAILIYTFKKPSTIPAEVSCAAGSGASGSASEGAALHTREASGDVGTASGVPAGSTAHNFAHNMINDFMIQIIRNLGGGETELGYANFLQAILELPVMAMIGLVLKKISSRSLLTFSGAAFFVKILILVFASNMAMMYLSQSVQLFAFAVFIRAAAFYVSVTIGDLDQVKGQAYVTSAITIGGVFSNLLSGVILDHFGIRPMLLCGTIVCAVGVVIGYIAMKKLPHNRNSLPVASNTPEEKIKSEKT